MCGIAAIIATQDTLPIQAMVSAMHHRGPDDRGTWSHQRVHLGMARLSIVDLSEAGHQPMATPDGRYTIVFNGEIYNYKTLRHQLLKGIAFKSNTDTEVVLHLFQKFGIKSVKHLRGMFAFLVWDKKEKKLWGARDRMGIKPFWYYHNGDNLVISSEIKAMLASGIIPYELNQAAIRQYFLYGSVQHPNSIVKNVASLPPASYFSFSNNKITINTYWEFPNQINQQITLNDAVDQFKEIYNESINLRFIADRTVGIFQSSGLDSVSMLAANRSSQQDIKTFTIGFDTQHPKYYSEAEKAKSLSEHFGYANNSSIVSANDAVKNNDEFIIGLDQPSIDGLNTFLVSKFSKPFLTVALSGLGGDELMLGYPRNINLFNQKRRHFKLPKAIAESFLIKKLSFPKSGNQLFNRIFPRVSGAADLRLLYWSNRLINQPWKISSMLNFAADDIMPEMEAFFAFDENNYSSNLFNKICYYEMRSYMLSQLLRDMDAVSMSQSIEVRFPLLDHKLVEFLFSLPDHFKFKSSNKRVNHRTSHTTYASSGGKRMFRLAYENDLPKGFFDTPKQGFQLPYYQWMIGQKKDEIHSTIEDSPLLQAVVSSRQIDATLGSVARGQLDTNGYLLFILGAWDKRFKTIAPGTSFESLRS